VSDVMLHGILNMPPGIWDNSDIHKAQRHDAYKQASKKILEFEANQVKAKALIIALHEQVYDNSHLDKQVELYFALKDQG
jgi:hypothetical protein